MLKQCLRELTTRHLAIPFLVQTITDLTTRLDNDQLLHRLQEGICLDQNQLWVQYIPGTGWRCQNLDFAYVGRKPICRVVEKTLNESLLVQGGGASSWYLPTLAHELGELEALAVTLQLEPKTLVQAVNDAIIKGELKALTPEEWLTLDHTDSIYPLSLEQITTLASPRWPQILESLQQGGSQEASMVLYREQMEPYLLVGNTRLMFSKFLQHQPLILPVYL